MRIVARSVLSHTTPSTAFRGFGNPAADLGGRIEHGRGGASRSASTRSSFGCRTWPRPGEAFIPGDTPADGDWARTVRAGGRDDRLGDARRRPGRGRGLAVGLKSGPTTGLSYSTVRLLADGSVIVHAGTSDMGQGARTIFAQIAAEELGAPLDWVTVVMGDTAVVPYDQQTSASRSSVLMGNSILNGCREVQAKLRAMAARLESVDGGRRSSVDRGEVRIGDRVLPIRDVLIRGLGRLGGEVIGIGEMRKEAEPGPSARRDGGVLRVQLHGGRGRGRPRRPATSSVARHVTVSDVGKALNPRQVRGQDEGAAVMGLGHTLMEHYIFDDDGPDPEPRRDRLPDPDEHGPAARAWRATSSRTRMARARTARRG